MNDLGLHTKTGPGRSKIRMNLRLFKKGPDSHASLSDNVIVQSFHSFGGVLCRFAGVIRLHPRFRLGPKL